MTGKADAPENKSKSIVIPLDERTLGEFIASLLGQRRSIERDFDDRRFEIDSNWLLNLDEVILQRINSQHTAKLVSFSARIYFANGKVVTLEEEKAFRHYNDMSSEISVGVDLRWSFLIKFPLVEIPEKQEIRFAAFTDPAILGEIKSRAHRSRPSFVSMQRSDERLFYVVQFTNVTWGEDLGATIDTYVTGKTEAVPRWKQYIRNVPVGISVPLAVTVTLIASLAALMGSEVTGAVTTVGTINTKYGDFSKLANSLNTVGSKIIVPRRLYNTKNADRTNISIFVCKNWHCVSCDCVCNRAALDQREKFHKSQRCFA